MTAHRRGRCSNKIIKNIIVYYVIYYAREKKTPVRKFIRPSDEQIKNMFTEYENDFLY